MLHYQQRESKSMISYMLLSPNRMRQLFEKCCSSTEDFLITTNGIKITICSLQTGQIFLSFPSFLAFYNFLLLFLHTFNTEKAGNQKRRVVLTRIFCCYPATLNSIKTYSSTVQPLIQHHGKNA